MRKHTVLVATLEAAATHLGLADGAGHHRQVVHGTTGARDGHVHGRVGGPGAVQFVLCHVTGGLLALVEDDHDVLLKGLNRRSAGSSLVILTVLTKLLEFCTDRDAGLVVGLLDAGDGVLGEVFVVDAGGETERGARADGQTGELVEELCTRLGPLVWMMASRRRPSSAPMARLSRVPLI